MQHRPYHLGVNLEVLRGWDDLREEEREELLADPWRFKDLPSAGAGKASAPWRGTLLVCASELFRGDLLAPT